ncbi:3-hydroxyacyl-CoA dehydrogenase family protein [Compostibacter hankyongensis]|uniref:3-hydroxybutyryl-CoA dehydrogenase n=1 Tax=Compostibacter hankyongensis TaxID=1007089 RepID=A0ABP8G432_9BACT
MQNIAVIGAGTMGNGIAHIFAQKGFNVTLCDLSPEALEKALQTISRNLDRQLAKARLSAREKTETLSRLRCSASLQESVREAALVVEAATEDAPTKLDIFRMLDREAPPAAILATNTSSISITRIAAATRRPGKVVGMHFMNPVPVMELVEVIRGYHTSGETVAAVTALARDLGKTPCLINDYPGFAANRILMPMINEAIFALHEGVGDVEAIDTVMRLGMSHPMGPLQLADFIGLDVCLSILQVLAAGLGGSKYAPCPLLVNMVTAGCLGIKSGEGFYTYTPGSKERKVSTRFIHPL